MLGIFNWLKHTAFKVCIIIQSIQWLWAEIVYDFIVTWFHYNSFKTNKKSFIATFKLIKNLYKLRIHRFSDFLLDPISFHIIKFWLSIELFAFVGWYPWSLYSLQNLDFEKYYNVHTDTSKHHFMFTCCASCKLPGNMHWFFI